jgi:hypothetical protein
MVSSDVVYSDTMYVELSSLLNLIDADEWMNFTISLPIHHLE